MKATAPGIATAQYAGRGLMKRHRRKDLGPGASRFRTAMTRTLQREPIRMPAIPVREMVCFIVPATLHGHAAQLSRPARR
jgi:hypothetical protein